MADPSKPARRVTPATIALATAAVLTVAAIGIRVFGSSERVEAAAATNASTEAAPGPGNMEAAVASLRERLRQDPDNHEAWHMLGLAHRDLGQFTEAEQAFRRAMELAPQNADYVAYTAEMMFLRGGRNVPPEAERLMRRVLELQPGNPQARYYLATLKDIRGDHRGAIDDLIAILRDAPADAPWEPQVRNAATRIAQMNQIDLDNRLPAARQPAQSVATGAIPGPTSEQMQAASAIPPSQQDAMSREMVARLRGRLQQNPRDADRWIFLMRSEMVLNNREAASAALRSGLAAFQGDNATQQRLRTAAQELGVPNPS